MVAAPYFFAWRELIKKRFAIEKTYNNLFLIYIGRIG